MARETLLASALRSATTGESANVVLPGAIAVFYLDVTARAGTTPTLDVDIEAIDPESGQFYVVDSFTQIGDAVGKERKVVNPLPDAILRVSWDIGGTASPSYTFSVSAVSK